MSDILYGGGAGTGDVASSTLTTKGDIFVRDATAVVRFGVGADGTSPIADSSQATGWRWGSVSGAGIQATIVDAKGDLIVASAADTVTRKAVGADGTVLQAASADATGVSWGTVTNTNIDAAAGIALSKLATDPLARANHTGTQAVTTLTAGTAAQVLLNNATPAPTWTTLSGDVTVSSTGVTAIGAGVVTNTMLAGSIALSKLVTDPLARANHTGTQDASTIGSGTMATARLGGGTASASTVLRGDSTWGVLANASISTTAAIAVSKLASGTAGQVLLNDGTPTPTWTSVTGDVTISSSGVTAIAAGAIVDADVSAGGITTRTKLPSALAYEDEANTFTAVQNVTPGSGAQAIVVTASGAVASSETTGGAVNVTNTSATGPGLVVYSNQGGTQNSALVAMQADNTAFDHSVLRVRGSNATHVAQFVRDAGNPSNGNVVLVTGSDGTSMDTTLGVSGFETAKGTIKVTHNKPTAADASASAISIDLQGTSTEAQGIFCDTSASYILTGKLLNIRARGTEKLVLKGNGEVTLTGKLGINVAPQTNHAITVDSTAGSVFWTNYPTYTLEQAGAAVQAQRYDALDFTTRRSNYVARVTAKGTRSVSDGWFGFYSVMVDRSEVRSLTITSWTSTGGQLTANFTSGVSGNIAANDRIAIWGATGSQAAAVNTYHTVVSVSGDTQVVIPISDAGGTPTGGTLTNSPYLGAFAATVQPSVARSIPSGSAQFANDVGGFLVQNAGSSGAKGTDAFYVSSSASFVGSGSAWITILTSDANSDYGIKLNGAIAANGAAFDCSGGSLGSGASAVATPYAGRIASKNNSGTIRHLLSMEQYASVNDTIVVGKDGDPISLVGTMTPVGGITPVKAVTTTGRISEYTVLNESSNGTNTIVVANTLYVVQMRIQNNATLTGIGWNVGSLGGTDNVIVSLYDSTGSRVAVSNSTLVGTLNTMQEVPFTATYAAKGPGLYFVGIQISGTTDRYRAVPAVASYKPLSAALAQGSFAAPSSITPPSSYAAAVGPIVYLY